MPTKLPEFYALLPANSFALSMVVVVGRGGGWLSSLEQLN
jgi:hypothetical protein